MLKKLAALILEFLIKRLDEDKFKQEVRDILATIEPFDPNKEQEALTDLQKQWINEVLAENNTPL